MASVFLVVEPGDDGEHIQGVFSSHELGVAFAEKDGWWEVHEWDVDARVGDEQVLVQRVTIRSDTGNISRFPNCKELRKPGEYYGADEVPTTRWFVRGWSTRSMEHAEELATALFQTKKVGGA